MSFKIIEVIEQNAVFDGKPEFPPMLMIMNLLNHYSYGGTLEAVKNARDSGDMENPNLYIVRFIVEVKELKS